MNKLSWVILTLILSVKLVSAQPQMVSYAGNSGNESFNDILQLSDGSFLVIGVADNLTWLPPSTPLIPWPNPGIANNLGGNRICFLIHFDRSLSQMISVYHLPAGAAENFRFIKSSNLPAQSTGAVFISGDTDDSQNGGYFIGRLNQNFINGSPTGFSWIVNVTAKDGQYPDVYQPWDVGSDGKVIYVSGDSHDYNWSAMYRLDVNGNREVVPGWRVHWINGGGEYYGAAANYSGGIQNLLYSAIVFKRDGNRCELRSINAQDYNTWTTDGNGGTKKGKWPLDVLYNGPCNPGQPGNSISGPGYTGYSPSASFTYGPTSVCIDRRDNSFYTGFNFKSVLPGGNPDFEPAVMAMENNGALRWWSRLYHEVNPNGDTLNSSPDQYVDALAIDYNGASGAGMLVVGARCHGNNVENLWEGNQIASNPSASGFQNRFTGNNGNIHISWIGKLMLTNGTLQHSTYMAEYAEGTGSLGQPHPDPNLDGWPNPNGGWPNVNTTYLGKNMIRVSADGSVLVTGAGRRTITTANAYQKMVKPGNGGLSCWNEFVRLYSSDLSSLLYSSLLVGAWDTLTQAGGDNVDLMGAIKTDSAIIVAGMHKGTGNELPLTNIAPWGQNQYSGQTAVLACLKAGNFINLADDASNTTTPTGFQQMATDPLSVYPNPASSFAFVNTSFAGKNAVLRIFDMQGRLVSEQMITQAYETLQCSNWTPGLYTISVSSNQEVHTIRLQVQATMR
jgi:hypothetical protein